MRDDAEGGASCGLVPTTTPGASPGSDAGFASAQTAHGKPESGQELEDKSRQYILSLWRASPLDLRFRAALGGVTNSSLGIKPRKCRSPCPFEVHQQLSELGHTLVLAQSGEEHSVMTHR